jgi:predicted DNA-binding transcriptional regulator AlpA
MNLQSDGEEVVDVIGVYKLTGIRDYKLYELLRWGSFPKPSKVGNKNFWKKSDIAAYLESKKVNASEPKPEKDDTADKL